MKSLLVLLAVVFGHSAVAVADPVDDKAARFVTDEGRRLGGQEYQGARQVKRSGVGGDGRISFAVVYTIEGIGGGNNYNQYVVAFLNAGSEATATRPVLVGGGGYRSVWLERVEAHRIVLKTKNYTKSDATCCPSLNGTSSYWLEEGELREGPGLRFEP